MNAKDIYNAVPHAMTGRSQWLCYQAVQNNGRVTKPPHSARTGAQCDAHAPANWHTFAKACEGVQRFGFSGIGFMPGDGIVALDLDKCRDRETGVLDRWASEIIEKIPGYWEVSPSGTGLHGFFLWHGDPLSSRRKDGLEFYFGKGGNFVTVTGRRLDLATDDLTDATQTLTTLYQETFPVEDAERQERPEPSASALELSDTDLLAKARNVANGKGEAFAALFDRGDVSAYGGDHSRADMALAGYLAFWTGRDAQQMERLFSASALALRPKWRERADYRQNTLQRAIENCRDTYAPKHGSVSPSDIPLPEAPPEEDEDDTSLPDNLPEPIAPAITGKLALSSWKSKGRQLRRWREQSVMVYRWAAGDWYNSAREDIEHGAKIDFLTKEFGSDQVHNIQNYASVCARIKDKAERKAVPAWWVYRNLVNVEPEMRQAVYRAYHEGVAAAKAGTGSALNVKRLREMLGITEETTTLPKQGLSQYLRREPEVKRRVTLYADVHAKARAGDAEAQRKLDFIDACLEGRSVGENYPAIFHPWVKNETPNSPDFEMGTALVCDQISARFSSPEQGELDRPSPSTPTPPSCVYINTGGGEQREQLLTDTGGVTRSRSMDCFH